MNRAVLRFRLLQLSPFVVGALLACAWFSLPSEARSPGLASLYSGQDAEFSSLNSADHAQVQVMEALVRQKRGLKFGETVDEEWFQSRPAESLARSVSSALARVEPPVCDEYGAPRPLSSEEAQAAFDNVAAFEEKYHASVAVFVISSAPEPPVAFRSVANDAVLTEGERTAMQAGGTLERLRRQAREQATGPLLPDLSMVNAGGMGGLYEGRQIGFGTLFLNGRLWEAYTVAAEGKTDETLGGGDWTSIEDRKLELSADAISRAADGVVLVLGPIDAGHTLVRPAERVRAGESAGLYELLDGESARSILWEPVALDSRASSRAGGADLAEAAFAGSGRAPRVAVIALYDSHPRTQGLWEELGRTPVSALRVWTGANLGVIVGALGVLLMASLIASPLAFRAERLYREHIEVGRERARVQREAETRVVRRLDELSARMDELKERASDATAANVAGVSEDIEATVAELRRILGEVTLEDDIDD